MKKTNLFKKILIGSLISSIFVHAADTPLNFSAEHNNIQILPQKFEYTLLDESSIKLGDILIDSKSLNFQLEFKQSNPNEVKVIFSWPAGLLKEGELTLYNNYGKALIKEEITKDKIQIIAGENTKDSLLRSEKATFTTDYQEEEFLEEIKYLPFLKFCIAKKDKSTKIELCSSELYVSSDDNKLTIKLRKSSQREAVVIINGKEAGDQGIIFLNDKNESINFKAQSESGALLEIITKLKPIDFKDVVISDDQKTIKFKGVGGFPVKEEGVKKINDTTWEVSLPTEFPVFYVQGEGGMPMKQEFNIKGAVPQEKMRSFLVSSLVEKTYSNSISLEARLPKGVSAKPKDPLSTVIQKKNQRFTWNLLNLTPNTLNKRFLVTAAKDSEATIAYDIFRGYRFEGYTQARILSPLNLILLDLDLFWWLNNLRSGLAFRYSMPLSKPQTVTSFSDMELSYLHRLSSGLNFVDPSFFVGATYKMLKINDTSFAVPGILIGRKAIPNSIWMSTIADWYQWKFQYFSGQNKTGMNLKSIYSFDFTNFYGITDSQFLNYSLGILKYQTDSTGDFSKDQLSLTFGWNKLF